MPVSQVVDKIGAASRRILYRQLSLQGTALTSNSTMGEFPLGFASIKASSMIDFTVVSPSSSHGSFAHSRAEGVDLE
jgi:hypothetical protein